MPKTRYISVSRYVKPADFKCTPFCTPKRGIQGFSSSNPFQKLHFLLKSWEIPKFRCEIHGKYSKFQENTKYFRSISALKICPSLFASLMPHLGYKLRGYINFTMFLHVFSNVPPHSILFWGTRIKGTFLSPFRGLSCQWTPLLLLTQTWLESNPSTPIKRASKRASSYLVGPLFVPLRRPNPLLLLLLPVTVTIVTIVTGNCYYCYYCHR